MTRTKKQKKGVKTRHIIITGLCVMIIAGVFVALAARQNDKTSLPDESIAGSSIGEAYSRLSPQAKKLYMEQSDGLTKPVPQRLVELDQLTIGCFGPQRVMQMSNADSNLGGQCCGTLTDIEAYEIQLKALQRFIGKNGNIDLIPKDPYDVPVEHAKLLLSFDQIVLTPDQQAIYDEAIRMSHHGGPCCCKCWKWYVMSGLARKLIVDYGWDENQIAELWDTSSSCGHSDDMNMHSTIM